MDSGKVTSDQDKVKEGIRDKSEVKNAKDFEANARLFVGSSNDCRNPFGVREFVRQAKLARSSGFKSHTY